MDSYIWKTCLEALEIEMFMAVLCLVVVSLALLRVVGYWVGTRNLLVWEVAFVGGFPFDFIGFVF